MHVDNYLKYQTLTFKEIMHEYPAGIFKSRFCSLMEFFPSFLLFFTPSHKSLSLHKAIEQGLKKYCIPICPSDNHILLALIQTGGLVILKKVISCISLSGTCGITENMGNWMLRHTAYRNTYLLPLKVWKNMLCLLSGMQSMWLIIHLIYGEGCKDMNDHGSYIHN